MNIRLHFAFLTAFETSLVDVMREKNVIVEIPVEVLIDLLTFGSCFIFRQKNDQDYPERKRNGLIISGHAFAHSLHSDEMPKWFEEFHSFISLGSTSGTCLAATSC